MTETGQQSVVSRFVIVALGVPVVLTAATVGITMAWRGDLPNPVAIHWGGSGAPDGVSHEGWRRAALGTVNGGVFAC